MNQMQIEAIMNQLEFDSGTYKSHFETTLGEEIWQFLRQLECVYGMQAVSRIGRPAVAGIDELLHVRYGDEVRDNQIKRMIGRMIRQIMEACGYRLHKNNVRFGGGMVFVSGSSYVVQWEGFPDYRTPFSCEDKNFEIRVSRSMARQDNFMTTIHKETESGHLRSYSLEIPFPRRYELLRKGIERDDLLKGEIESAKKMFLAEHKGKA